MKHNCTILLSSLAAALLTTSPTTHAQTLTQSFELRPGWNAVWLEVELPDRNPAVAFADLPVASVWTWSDRVSATDFIQNPGDAGWNRAQWLAFFPPDSPEAPLSNLGAVLSQRAYLLKIASSNNVTWSVSGRPVLRSPKWAPDSFNLRGFPADPVAAPTFRAFFRASPAHFDAANQRLEQILRLSPNGQWHPVSPDDTMRRGEAYWVYTRGLSDFVGPFHIELTTGDVLDFDASRGRIDLTIYNSHALPKNIRIAPVGSTRSPLLLLPRNLPGQTNLPVPLLLHQQPVSGASSHRLALGFDRSKLPSGPPPLTAASVRPANASRHTDVVSVGDSEGTTFFVGVRGLATSQDFTGLWLGTATITNVPAVPDSGGASGPGTVLTPFPLRLLLHVDSHAQVSLLRDVTLIYTSSTNATETNAPAVVTRPARLITDPAILAQLSSSDLREGRITGRRLTAPHFDFALAQGQFQLPLTGVFGLSNQVSGELSVPSNLPTNPFLHRYHPDHGTNRAYAITRHINLSFALAGGVPPGEGDQAMGGSYSETIVGLHKQPLNSSGSLLLRRVSDVGTLNAP
jgi:hypothetical protein